ncbi:MAG: histidinol-phosphatase, partial [Treponema sp.]|nr:histidinol-phosphatase [Treponema sp.]
GKKTGIKTDWHLKDEELDEYIETVLDARRRWEGKIKIYLGLELDFIEGLCSPADDDFQALPLDYIIGSVHYVVSPKNGELFAVDNAPEKFLAGFKEHFSGDGGALFKAYFRTNRGCIRSGGFDILAHPDLVKKNNGEFGFFSPEDPAYVKELEETAEVLASAIAEAGLEETQAGLGTRALRRPVAEINTGGMIRKRTADPYPSAAMLGFLRKLDVPLTINADAHAADHLGGHYEDAREALLKAGYASTVFFEGRRDGKALWREETL